jgi:hypothetical protein
VVARQLLLIARADLLLAWRRTLDLGAARLLGTVAAGAALALAEVFIAHRVALRLLALPEPAALLGRALLDRMALLAGELALMVTTASAVTLALPAVEGVEADPWWGSCPLEPAARALQSQWRVFAGLGWVLVLALPPLLALGLQLRPGLAAAARQCAGLLLLVVAAAAIGTLAALVLAALIPRRVLLPLSWTVTTAAAVGAVLWLRRLHPERLVGATEPEQLLGALVAMGGAADHPGPFTWLVGAAAGSGGLLPIAVAAVAATAVLVALWPLLARPAAVRLSAGPGDGGRPWRPWRLLDRALDRCPLGVMLCSRLRLLVRDLAQASQTLYLIGLGAVYVENLRSLPLSDPLARELAGLINLGMAGLLSAALALRFAYPAHLLEGEAHWWWSSGPVPRAAAEVAVTTTAALPPLLLSGGLFAASLAVTGPSHATAVGWWLVPWQALWLAALGVGLGPRTPDPRHGSWIDAALGGGGILFLALALGGVGWTTLAAGRWVIGEVLRELGVDFDPGLLLGRPWLPALALSAIPLLVWGRKGRRAQPVVSAGR